MRVGAARVRAHSRAHMRFVFQTMMSTRIHPPTSGYEADEPFNSRCQIAAAGRSRSGNFVAFRDRAGCPHLQGWWSQTGSNRRPHACKARALPTELWPLISKRPAQLGAVIDPSSARPRVTQGVVGPGGLEPPTSRLSGVCSNQLSYRPLKRSAQTPAL